MACICSTTGTRHAGPAACAVSISPASPRRAMPREVLSIWTIYEHPLDYPHDYVARRFEVRDHGVMMTRDMFVAETLEELRALLPPGLFRLPRTDGEPKAIVESWC